jgi:hypothetical protein
MEANYQVNKHERKTGPLWIFNESSQPNQEPCVECAAHSKTFNYQFNASKKLKYSPGSVLVVMLLASGIATSHQQ